MKIRVEGNSINTKHISGVGYYSKHLTEALSNPLLKNTVSVFSHNFLNRQPLVPLQNTKSERTTLIPLRIFAKLISFGLYLPFDIFLSRVDLTLFPNFSRWPVVKSRVTATTIHDLTYLYYPELMEEKNLYHLRRVVSRSIKKSDFIITVSEAVKTEIIKEFSIEESKIIVTPVPPKDSFYNKNTNEVHNKYSIPTSKYILFIGNIEPRKNIKTLVEAYQKLPKSIIDSYSLVIAGGVGWKSEESLQAITDAKDNGFNIIQTGYIDEEDKSALYQKSSLFVLPSLYEGFGMPVLEAFASRVPVICADIPVLREAAHNGALYFSPKSSKDLTYKIKTLLENDTLARNLSENGSKQLSLFSWEKNAQRITHKANEYLK